MFLTWTKIVPAALVAVVVAFLAGRHTAPVMERVVEVEKKVVVEKEQTTVVQQVDVHELLQEVQKVVRRNNVQRKVVTVEAPDGTKTVTETETDKSTTDTSTSSTTDTTASENTREDKVREVVKVEERIKLVEKKLELKWSAAVDVGYYVPALWGEGIQSNILPGDMILGVSVNRTVAGPFSVGAWANTAWGAGLQLRVVW